MEKPKALAFDFDGVIFPFSNGWSGGELYEAPAPYAMQMLSKLYQHGYEIIIFTVYSRVRRKKDIMKWISHYMGDDYFEYKITDRKPREVLAFIDDRAIRFTNWLDIVKYFI